MPPQTTIRVGNKSQVREYIKLTLINNNYRERERRSLSRSWTAHNFTSLGLLMKTISDNSPQLGEIYIKKSEHSGTTNKEKLPKKCEVDN